MHKIVWLAGAILVSSLASAAQANQPFCREYTKQVWVGGQPQSGYGTACMQPDGSWAVSEQQSQPGIQLTDHYYGNNYGAYRPAPIYAPPPVYYPPYPPAYRQPFVSNFVLGFNFWDDDNRGHRWRNGGYRYRDGGRGHGHWNDRGHGHGHGYGRGYGRDWR